MFFDRLFPSRTVPAHSALAHYCRVCNTQLNSCKQVNCFFYCLVASIFVETLVCNTIELNYGRPEFMWLERNMRSDWLTWSSPWTLCPTPQWPPPTPRSTWPALPSTQSFPLVCPQCTPTLHHARLTAKGQPTTTLARLSSPIHTTTNIPKVVHHLPSHQDRHRPHPSIHLEAEGGDWERVCQVALVKGEAPAMVWCHPAWPVASQGQETASLLRPAPFSLLHLIRQPHPLRRLNLRQCRGMLFPARLFLRISWENLNSPLPGLPTPLSQSCCAWPSPSGEQVKTSQK